LRLTIEVEGTFLRFTGLDHDHAHDDYFSHVMTREIPVSDSDAHFTIKRSSHEHRIGDLPTTVSDGAYSSQ
jgi:hypothetical protein